MTKTRIEIEITDTDGFYDRKVTVNGRLVYSDHCDIGMFAPDDNDLLRRLHKIVMGEYSFDGRCRRVSAEQPQH